MIDVLSYRHLTFLHSTFDGKEKTISGKLVSTFGSHNTLFRFSRSTSGRVVVYLVLVIGPAHVTPQPSRL